MTQREFKIGSVVTGESMLGGERKALTEPICPGMAVERPWTLQQGGQRRLPEGLRPSPAPFGHDEPIGHLIRQQPWRQQRIMACSTSTRAAPDCSSSMMASMAEASTTIMQDLLDAER